MVINVTEWLDETTEKFPDKIAISDENKQITFKKFRDMGRDFYDQENYSHTNHEKGY